MKHPWDRWINSSLLRKQLGESVSDSIAITTIPIVSDLIGKLPVKRWIYYCVDDFSTWPGLDGKALLQHEDRLIKKVDTIVCVSDKLRENIKSRGRDSTILTHGVDTVFWQNSCQLKTTDEFDFDPNQSLALFWGVVDRRMNADWLIALADRLTKGSIILAGPQQDPDPRILHHERIKAIGPVAFEQLPDIAQKANVLIMPYADLPVTRAMQPLKLKEYLATLRPVVVSPLPSVKPWQHCLEMAETREQFVECAISHMNAAKRVSSKHETICDALQSETWAAKSAQFQNLISG